MKRLSLFTILLIAGLGIGASSDHRSQEVVGLWKKSNDWHHLVFMRRADGTYREKGLLLLDALKAPVYYESTGDWRLQGGQYLTTAHSWSESTFSKSVGRTYKLKVLQISEQHFRYVSTDNADEDEQRIGNASDIEFDQTNVDPFPPYGGMNPEIIRKVKKALPVTP